MYYWNKENFEGLLEAAAVLEETEETSGLAAYCRYRHDGLRKQSFEVLRDWLESCASWTKSTRRTVCLAVLELDARLPQVHHLLSHPLLAEFVLPTLRQWHHESQSLEPTRWLGILERDDQLLRHALELDPSDVPVRRLLVDFALGEADYQTHHLYEDFFIGEVEDAYAALAAADALLRAAPSQDSFQHRRAEAQYLRRLLDDWVEYSKAPSGSFPEWCKNSGRSHTWSVAYYYQPRGAS